uniref:EscU/YscU/HrcU family type III secretion system export apparatus switch protein n=1 Tax=Paenirhodobacter enshiensis TaxID=1105367 RepID=UPI0035B14280
MSEQDDDSREYEPTQHKIDEARRKGDLVRSTDISTACGYAGVLLCAVAFGAGSLIASGSVLTGALSQAETLSRQILGAGQGLFGGLFWGALKPLIPWAALPAGLVLAGLFAQRALVFAPEKLLPRMDRINPVANARQKFGPNGLFEFLKGCVKLMLIGAILGLFLSSRLPGLLMTQRMGVEPAITLMLRLLTEFLMLVTLIAAVMGAIDYLWQRAAFLRRNRMSRKELTDEMKQSEGDPHIKSQRRQKAVEIATRQMIADVAKASVVIVNPTHYAVALKWERGARRAPVCLAKGVDEIAARIRAAATEAGVPIHADPPTARALHASVEVGDEIRPEHYRAVATAIRFAERIRRQIRPKRG